MSLLRVNLSLGKQNNSLVVGSNGGVETITLSSENDAENGTGGEADSAPQPSEEEGSVNEEYIITEE